MRKLGMLALLAACGLGGCGISSNLKSDGRAVRVGSNETSARAFLEKNHPALAGQMVTQPLKLMAVHSNLCNQGRAYIPVYIPSR
jgi:hypothetical protein